MKKSLPFILTGTCVTTGISQHMSGNITQTNKTEIYLTWLNLRLLYLIN